MKHNTPAIILIDPQLGENIGMVARAMLNCGLTDLRIVRPRDGWPSEAAIRASSGALEKGVIASLFDTTTDAIADCNRVYATTARPRDLTKAVYTARSAMEEAHSKIASGENIAILFGAERTGLHNDDIALANGIITLPLNPEFTSLNLAQAVLLVSYEYLMQADNTADLQMTAPIANRDAFDNLTSRLIDTLDAQGFFRTTEMRPTTELSLINLFSRMDLTENDINILHGVISSLNRQK